MPVGLLNVEFMLLDSVTCADASVAKKAADATSAAPKT
jgi:hypothetical protein